MFTVSKQVDELIKAGIKMWDDPPVTPNAVEVIHVAADISHDALEKLIARQPRDILITPKEDIENNITKLELVPYGGSSTFSPLKFNIILTDTEKKLIEKHNDLTKKLISKKEAKSLALNKYKVGDILILRGKIKDGSVRNVKEFEVKKVIWSVKSLPVNVLILKQLSGINTNMSLTKNDCKKYHIKYEPGLQVYPMNLNFNKKKKI